LSAEYDQDLFLVLSQAVQSGNLPDVSAGEHRQLCVAERKIPIDDCRNNPLPILAPHDLNIRDTVTKLPVREQAARVIHYKTVSIRFAEHDVLTWPGYSVILPIFRYGEPTLWPGVDAASRDPEPGGTRVPQHGLLPSMELQAFPPPRW